MLPNSHTLQFPPELISVLQQLKIESLTELCSYDTKFITEHFDEEQLNTLNKALRHSLWQAKLLPAKMEDLNQQHLPLEVLGLAPQIHSDLTNKGIQTITEFIRSDRTDHLTDQWPGRTRLAVQTRIFCLLTLSPSEMDELRQSFVISIPSSPINISSENYEFVDKPDTKKVERIEALSLSYNIYKSLQREGVETINHLCVLSDKDLLKIPGIGTNSLAEIRHKLANYSNQVPLEQPRLIEILGLSRRPYNRLKLVGINTIEQLAAMSDDNLRRIPYLSTKSLAEIQEKLQDYLASCGETALQSEQSELQQENPQSNALLEDKSSISALELPLGIHNALIRAGIKTIDQLAKIPPEEVLKIHNLGSVSAEKVKAKLSSYLAQKSSSTELMISTLSVEPQSLKITTSIDALDLPLRIHNTLIKNGISTIGQLMGQPIQEVIKDARNLGGKALYEIETRLATYLAKNDLQLASKPTMELPETELFFDKSPYSSELLAAVKFGLSRLTQREMQVISLRYGLEKNEYLTLEQVGKQLEGVTRERVRQIEVKGLRKLKGFLKGYKANPINTFVSELFQKTGGIVSETQLPDMLKMEFEVEQISLIRSIQLVFHLREDIKWLKQAKVWVISNELVSADEVLNIQVHIFELIEKNLVPMPIDDLLTLFKQSEYYRRREEILSDEFISACLHAHSALVEDEYGYVGLEKWTRTRLDDMVAALRKIGKPAHYTIITEETNALLPFDQQAKPHNIHAQMQRLPDIFVRVGHGVYGLKEWNLHDDGNLANAAYRVLKRTGHPLHINLITDRVLTTWQVNASSVYAAMGNDPRVILLGESVFSLCEWEKERSFEPEPILPFCSSPLPDISSQADTLLESVVIAREYLNQNPGVDDFLTYMLEWVRAEPSISNWLKQGILNVYYLVGLIPYTFRCEGENLLLRSTLPLLELSELRRYCLQRLTQRLLAMPKFWWIVLHHQPGTVSDFAQHFIEVHPFEFDDVGNRLKILSNLGAVQRLPYGRYQLTSFGASLAEEWAKQPAFNEFETKGEIPEEDLSILDLGLW